jgi:hypothetical protein
MGGDLRGLTVYKVKRTKKAKFVCFLSVINIARKKGNDGANFSKRYSVAAKKRQWVSTLWPMARVNWQLSGNCPRGAGNFQAKLLISTSFAEGCQDPPGICKMIANTLMSLAKEY